MQKESTPLVQDEAAIQFAGRLNDLLDDRKFESKGKGRQVALAKKYRISQTATRKWLEGFGFPKTSQMIQVAIDFDCHFEWLATGRGPRDMGPTATNVHTELLRRMDSAPAETQKLIELALLPDADLAQSPLSPSLKGLVGYIKNQIKEETRGHNDPNPNTPSA